MVIVSPVLPPQMPTANLLAEFKYDYIEVIQKYAPTFKRDDTGHGGGPTRIITRLPINIAPKCHLLFL